MKKLICGYVLLLLVINFLFISCPFMEQLNTPINYLAFNLSEQDIKTNTPIELTVKYCSGELDKNEAYVIQLIDDVEMELLEGTLLECDDENVLFVDFVRPENQIESDSKENEDLLPYIKLSLIFKKAGTYDFCIKRTDKNDPVFVFNACIYKTITVTED